MTLYQSLRLLAPELVLFAAAFVVLGIELVWRDRQKPWLPYAALAGLAGAAAATALLWGEALTGLEGVYAADSFAVFMKWIALGCAGLVVLSAGKFMQERTPYQGEFYFLLLLATLGITVVASATNLLLIFLAIELVSFSSYILTGYIRTASSEGAIKYFLYGAVASAVMLYGMSLIYGVTGSVQLNEIAAVLAQDGDSMTGIIYPAAILIIAGFGFKMGVVPFHQWAPDAYQGAPTPVTAFLSVGPKAAGFAAVIRVFLVAFPAFQSDQVPLLAAISAITMTLGNLTAIWQTNIKRLLAYSSIAQAGYILLGMTAATDLGLTALLLYLVVYLFSNLGAFAVVIIFSNNGGGDEVGDYAGLSVRSPALALAMLFFLLSLAGIPPTAGFIGKFYLFTAIMRDGLLWLMLVGVLNGVVSLYYYLEIVRQMFVVPPENEQPVSASRSLTSVLYISLAGIFLLGLYPAPLIGVIKNALHGFAAGG